MRAATAVRSVWAR